MAKAPGLGERACPKCREVIKIDASICKHCGTTFTDEEVATAREKAANSKRKLGFGCLGLVLLLGFCGLLVDKSDKGIDAKKPAAQADAAPDATLNEKSLGYAPSVFADRFNALSDKTDNGWRLDNLRVEDSGFKHMFNDHIGLVGQVADDGKMSGLIVIGTGDGTVSSGVDVFMVMSMVYCAATNTTDLKKCGPPVLKLTQAFKEGGKSSVTVVNNVRITYQRSDATGSLMSVDAI